MHFDFDFGSIQDMDFEPIKCIENECKIITPISGYKTLNNFKFKQVYRKK